MFQLNPNLKTFWTTRKPYKLLRGGRFSGKTHDAAGMAAFLARNYSLRFLCIRQFQNRITDSVYTVIKEKIETAGWEDEFDIGVSSIKHKTTGSEFLFYGIARNLNDIKGTEGVDICWIEEGEGLTESQWEVIDPTIRKEGAEIWLLWNPKFVTDFVQTKLPRLLGDDCVVRHINYPENPFLSQTALDKAERLKAADPDAYRHIYLGEALTDDDSVVIKASWIAAAVDAHLLIPEIAEGRYFMGYDIADDGNDKCATIIRRGGLAFESDEWAGKEDELLKSTTRAYRSASKHGAHINYDSIGVGASAGAYIAELNQKQSSANKLRYSKFNAGAKVHKPKAIYEHKTTNEDFFSNLKSQAWWTVADRFRLTYQVVTAIQEGKEPPKYKPDELISICSKIDKLEQLKAELAIPRRDFDNNGKVKVESKKDLAKREVPSPNMADAFIMAYAPVSGGMKINPEALL